MKKILLITALLLAGFCLAAQTNITGVLMDSEGDILPVANIMLHRMPDTVLVKGVASEENGAFTINNIAKGTYMIKISYMGYNDFSKKIFIDGNAKEFKLGNVILQAGIMLEGARVIGKATAVTIKGDTVEYNPNAYKLQDNAVIEDLLKKLPGVQVDKDGSITAGGKEVTKVLLGGKEFFANDPTLATKNVPVKIVERVQVLDRKSEQETLTGISDGEEETVINLEIKKGQQQGWMGNLTGGIGRDIKNDAGNKLRFDENVFVNRLTSNSRFTGIANFNNINTGRGGRNTFGGTSGNTTAGMGGINIASFATDKLTVEGSGFFTYRNTNDESSSQRETFVQGSSFFDNSESNSETYNRSINANMRLTYKPDESNTFIFRPYVRHSHTDASSETQSATFDENHDPVNSNEHKRYSETTSISYSGEIDYSHKFGTSGRTLSFELGYSNDNSNANSKTDSKTTYNRLGTDSIIDHISKSNSSDMEYDFEVSYVEPLSKYHFLQLRYSYEQNNRDQESYTYSKDNAGNYSVLDTMFSNSYKNKYTDQQIHASFRTVHEKYNFQIGINISPQSTQSIRYVAGNAQPLRKRNVTNFGPMARFQYDFTKSHNIRVDYRTRTAQPSLSQLDPWKDISDPLITSYGNPDLKPSFTHSLEVRYNLNNRSKMRTFTVRLRGSTTQNSIVSKSFLDDNGHQERTYDNVNGVWSLGGDIMVNFPISTSFQLNTSSRAQLNHNVSLFDGQTNKTSYNRLSPNLGLQYSTLFMDLGISGTVTFTNTANSFNTSRNQQVRDYDLSAWTTVYLPLDFTFVSDISFKNGSGYAADYDVAQTVWNAGIEKSILKNRGTLKFTVNDILRDKKNISYSATDSYIQQRMTNTLNCYFMVSFSYRFNVFGGQSVDGNSPAMMRGGMMRRY